VRFLADRGCGDLLVRWTPDDLARSTAEGKIPRLGHWSEALASKRIGLDTLMNLAGLTSFAADQQAMAKMGLAMVDSMDISMELKAGGKCEMNMAMGGEKKKEEGEAGAAPAAKAGEKAPAAKDAKPAAEKKK